MNWTQEDVDRHNARMENNKEEVKVLPPAPVVIGSEYLTPGGVLFSIEVPMIGPSLNEVMGMNPHEYKKKHKTPLQMEVRKAIEGMGAVVEGIPFEIYCVGLFGPSRRRFDPENMSVTSKIITDVLVKEGIAKNDSSLNVRRSVFETWKGPRTCTLYALRMPR